jgi:hypothetical protein
MGNMRCTPRTLTEVSSGIWLNLLSVDPLTVDRLRNVVADSPGRTVGQCCIRWSVVRQLGVFGHFRTDCIQIPVGN